MQTKPTDKREYLAEPNYYRLAYQLAAQRLHAHLTRASMPGEIGEEIRLSGGDSKGMKADALAAAERGAKDVATEARSMLEWFAMREKKPWWRPRGRRLETGEKRLQQFLAETLLPGAVLLLAGIMAERGEHGAAEGLVRPFRARVVRADLSYRAAYNLACYEVTASASKCRAANTDLVDQEADAHFEYALLALREALSGTHGRRRTELGRWALRDPALKALRESSRSSADSSEDGTYASRFDELMRLYAISMPEQATGEATEADVPPATQASRGIWRRLVLAWRRAKEDPLHL